MKKEKRERSAGFIVVQRREKAFRVLGLYVNGSVDVPKGHVEDGESDFDAAIRECEEEAGLKIESENLRWGKASLVINRPHKDVVVYLAETNQDPVIKKNPVTGIYEHDGYKWMTWEEMARRCHKYLVPAVNWARKTITNT